MITEQQWQELKAKETKGKEHLKRCYEKAIIYYLDDGLTDKQAEQYAYMDVYVIDRNAILREVN